jgi:hypothetical protein
MNPLLRTFLQPDAHVGLKDILLNCTGQLEGLRERAADQRGA